MIRKLCASLGMVMVVPQLLRYWFLSALIDRERACDAVSQRAARWTGTAGILMRRALLGRVLDRVGRTATIHFGSLFTKPTTELGDRVYIGAYCIFGSVQIGNDTLIADHVCVPSGKGQHGIDRTDVPIRQQEGSFQQIHIGEDCWIGSHTTILADIGDHCVVGAGSVVIEPVESYMIVAGNPARVIADRRQRAGANTSETRDTREQNAGAQEGIS